MKRSTLTHKKNRHVRYRNGNGIAITLFAVEWLLLTVTGLTEKMFFGSSKNGIEPDFAVIGIAGFGGIIVTSIIGRALFGWVTKIFFGGDEEKAKRIDKVMTVAVMLLWMIVFCFGINILQKRL